MTERKIGCPLVLALTVMTIACLGTSVVCANSAGWLGTPGKGQVPAASATGVDGGFAPTNFPTPTPWLTATPDSREANCRGGNELPTDGYFHRLIGFPTTLSRGILESNQTTKSWSQQQADHLQSLFYGEKMGALSSVLKNEEVKYPDFILPMEKMQKSEVDNMLAEKNLPADSKFAFIMIDEIKNLPGKIPEMAKSMAEFYKEYGVTIDQAKLAEIEEQIKKDAHFISVEKGKSGEVEKVVALAGGRGEIGEDSKTYTAAYIEMGDEKDTYFKKPYVDPLTKEEIRANIDINNLHFLVVVTDTKGNFKVIRVADDFKKEGCLSGCGNIPCITLTPGGSPTPTETPTPTRPFVPPPPTSTRITPAPSITPSPTPTREWPTRFLDTPTPAPTETATNPPPTTPPPGTETPEPSRTPTNTPKPPTNTPEATATATIQPVPTGTSTSEPINTPLPTATNQPTALPTPVFNPTQTPLPEATATYPAPEPTITPRLPSFYQNFYQNLYNALLKAK